MEHDADLTSSVCQVTTFVGMGKERRKAMVMEKQDVRDKLEGIGEEVPPGGEGIAKVEHFVYIHCTVTVAKKE